VALDKASHARTFFVADPVQVLDEAALAGLLAEWEGKMKGVRVYPSYNEWSRVHSLTAYATVNGVHLKARRDSAQPFTEAEREALRRSVVQIAQFIQEQGTEDGRV
jgi:hypothetical protein